MDVPDPDATVEAPQAKIGRTAKYIREHVPAEPPWLVPGMIALGSTTEFNGREKIGKGYFLHYLVGALEKGESTVLGPAAAEPVRTLIFTEEPEQSLKEKFDLFDISNAMVVYQWELGAKDWLEIVDFLVQSARQIGAQMIYVDNISAATKTQDEAGMELARKMEPLAQKAKEYNLAVLYDRHQRKAAGKVEDAMRGSTALAGAVDIIVAMTRAETGSRERTLTSWGRLWDTNWQKQIELMEDQTGYNVLEGDWRTRILLERDAWTAKEFGARINKTDDTARQYLRDHPNVEVQPGAGQYGADLYVISKPPSLD
jgi:hypothetical protein